MSRRFSTKHSSALTTRSHPFRSLSRAIEANVPAKVLRDWGNRLRFGPTAPLSDECLWVDPRQITHAYTPDPAAGAPRLGRQQSGQVLGGDWDLSRHPVGNNIKYRACMAHFRDGVPWEETGLYDELVIRISRSGVYDDLRNQADVDKRYTALDALAQEAQTLGRLRARTELGAAYFRREHGGVLVHVARDGTVLRAGGGQHRFALAKALELPLMPVQLGVTHKQAVDAALLEKYRQRPVDYPLPSPLSTTQDPSVPKDQKTGGSINP